MSEVTNLSALPTIAQQSVLHPAGPDAAIIAQLAWILFIGGMVLFICVMVLSALSLRRGQPVRPMVWLVGGGVLLPVVLLSALLAFGTWRTAQLSQPSSQHAIKVAVIGHMWWWEVRYSRPDGGEDVVLANEIRVPVGQPVYLGLSSADVIHSFWAPALAGKVDMVPGRVHGMTVQADRAGIYRAQCAEYCGEQHARMALHVVAQPPEEFQAWLAAQGRPAASVPASTPSGADIDSGRRAFVEQRCSACHTVRGEGQPTLAGPAAPASVPVSATASVPVSAPDLTHFGSRLYLGAGAQPNNLANLSAWIANPHVAKPGVRMPASTDMDPATLRALAVYLESLK
jgi:cytochrome c oxidase subunit 2